MINIIQTAAYRFWHFRPVPSLLRSAAEVKQKRVSSTKMTWAPCDCTSLCAFLGSEKEEKRVSVTWSLLKPGGGQLGAPSRACKLGVLSADHEGSDVAGASKQDAMRIENFYHLLIMNEFIYISFVCSVANVKNSLTDLSYKQWNKDLCISTCLFF